MHQRSGPKARRPIAGSRVSCYRSRGKAVHGHRLPKRRHCADAERREPSGSLKLYDDAEAQHGPIAIFWVGALGLAVTPPGLTMY